MSVIAQKLDVSLRRHRGYSNFMKKTVTNKHCGGFGEK